MSVVGGTSQLLTPLIWEKLEQMLRTDNDGKTTPTWSVSEFYACVCMRVRVRTYLRARTCVCVFVCVYVCVCLYVCMCVCVRRVCGTRLS